jgi:glycosyltransferase involved in cell wall biosynthesis
MIPDKIFTIIIPCKNEETYIYNTLKSISTQYGVRTLKVIISDAYSTDNTVYEIHRAISDFTNLDIFIINGGGVSYGRNNGAKYSTTPFLVFMDADAILLNNDILWETYNQLGSYDLITLNHKSTTNNILDNIIWKFFNFIRYYMTETFSTGCFFTISKNKFNELGQFDETVTQSEDYLLSKKIPKNKFKILNRYVGQDDRRFKKMGYYSFIKLVILNYWNTNNISWFRQDMKYW